MDCSYHGDNESYDYGSRSKRKARKHYKCIECGRPIRPGDFYVYNTGRIRWESFDVWRTCAVCDRIISDMFPRCQPPAGELREALINCDLDLDSRRRI